MLHDKGTREGREQRYLFYIRMRTLTHAEKHINNKVRKRVPMTVAVFISVTGHCAFTVLQECPRKELWYCNCSGVQVWLHVVTHL